MDPEGMVAVVRNMQDAALCVTLLDGTRQYTLMPNSAVPLKPQVICVQPTQMDVQHTECQDRNPCDSSAQAVDGRYASIYKMAHCNMTPTSPPVTLTEFPPQRAELCPGHGNFEVGGRGSGENNHSPTRVSGSFRGGMSWPDRGSVCTPRPSHEPDAFANSLRKYPSMSPERTAEMVERLINYTQMKTAKTKSHASSECSTPDRLSRSSRRSAPDVATPEVSPSRERRSEEWECSKVYGRNYDIRCVRDVTRRVRESLRNMSTYQPYSQPVCPTIKERLDHLPPVQKPFTELSVTNSVNMETQAEIPMVSREVTTVPRVQPSVRNVAIPLSPKSSTFDAKTDLSIKTCCSSKSIQTAEAMDLTLKSVQTCFSSVDIQESKKVKNRRKSKSQEELRGNNDFEDEIVELIQNLTSCPDLDRESVMRSKLLKKLRKVHKTDRSERVKIKIGRCIKDQIYSEFDLKNFTRELSNELISKIKRHNCLFGNSTNVYRADLHSFRIKQQENCVDEVIKEWLSDIPIKNIDYLDRDVKKGHLLHTIACKVRNLVINKLKYNSEHSIRADIIEIIEDIPIDVSGHNKRFYLNRLVSELIKKIRDIFSPCHSRRRLRKECATKFIQPTEKDIKQFVRQEIMAFISKFHLIVCPETLKLIEVELIDILMDTMENIRLGSTEDVKEEILGMLAELISISEHQAISFANTVIYNLKDILDQSNYTSNRRSQTFIVLPNNLHSTRQDTTVNNTDFSIQGLTEDDINANLDFYTNQIINQINEWFASIKGFEEIDAAFKQVVVNDLAGDIVDRHKYLELNPPMKATDTNELELEHLKYQIFKWINKVVGEDNLDTLAHASDLMARINSIPVPMFMKPPRGKSSHFANCCKERRFSSPDPQRGQIDTIINEKEIIKQRRQSSPAGLSMPECCSSRNAALPPGGTRSPPNESIESSFSTFMGITSTPKSHAPSPNPEAQNRSHRSQGVGITRAEQSVSPKHSMRMGSSGNENPIQTSEPQRKHGSFSQTTEKNTGTQSSFNNPGRSNKANCCAASTINKGTLSPEPLSIKQLNDEYDAFVRNWVQQIPIVASSPEEQAIAEKSRIGFYNGVWKAITKLKMCPESLSNPFYYQDVFDDEVEELFNCLPQTTELLNKKHLLKAQLLDKTTNTNQVLVSKAETSSYKQQLVEHVSINLPKKSIDQSGKDVVRLNEDMLKMNLAENFILYMKYREGDKAKANVYRKRLMKVVEELVIGIKATHGKELQDIDAAAYVHEVVNALKKVPLPSDETMIREADEIKIGQEIEQWFSDLPLLPQEGNFEKIGKVRYKDALAKKIYDIEKEANAADSEALMKEEVRRFLEKMPLRPNEKENIGFMAEELVNRIKNRINDIVARCGERKKSVTFMGAYEYDDFSRNMPMCSSFSDMGRRAQIDQSSYNIADGTRVKDNVSYGQRLRLLPKRDSSDSQQQWYTLEETVGGAFAPPSAIPAKHETFPPCCQTSGKLSLPRSGSTPAQVSQPECWSTLDQISQPQSVSTHCQVSQPQSMPTHGQVLQPITHASCQTPAHSTSDDHASSPKDCRSIPEQRNNPLRFEQGSRHGPERFEHSHDIIHSLQQLESPVSLNYAPGTAEQGTGTRSPMYEETCQTRRSSAPPSYRTEGTGCMPQPDPRSRQHSPNTSIPSAQFSGEPIGFSTPQNAPPEVSPRPRKKNREVDKQKREAVKKRLFWEDSENESEDDSRCRCMEKFWRCRRKPFCPYGEKDFIPCFNRFPHPYFF